VVHRESEQLRTCIGYGSLVILGVFRSSIDIMRLFPINTSPGIKIAILTKPLGFGLTIRLP
jgi:hypothetical protein